MRGPGSLIRAGRQQRSCDVHRQMQKSKWRIVVVSQRFQLMNPGRVVSDNFIQMSSNPASKTSYGHNIEREAAEPVEDLWGDSLLYHRPQPFGSLVRPVR